jgi:hypothetical protein
VAVPSWNRASGQQTQQGNATDQSSANSAGVSLEVRLQLPDDSPFAGAANISITLSQPNQLGTGVEATGSTTFAGLAPGTYVVEASAPAFLTARQDVQIDAARSHQTLFLIMKPKPPRASPAAAAPTPSTTAPVDGVRSSRPVSWLPAGVDDAIPPVENEVACPLPQIMTGTGKRMNDLVSDLEKFSADERVEHFPVNKEGVRGSNEVRTFEYVVMVSQSKGGMFHVAEYRNGTEDPAQFQASIATQGLPALALIFHPAMAVNFDFKCEGLGQWKGRAAWQVHFEQRSDRPSLLRAYVINKNYYPVALKGRAWIDPGTYQLMRLETQSVKEIEDIQLKEDHALIEYGPVEFHKQNLQLWLPQTADLYVDRQGRRYYRRHTFSNFKLFSVSTSQIVGKTKESYQFTNTSDRDINGLLVVVPTSRNPADTVSLTFTIPAGKTIDKLVGRGEAINLPAASVAFATFTHDGPPDTIEVSASLGTESTVLVIPETPLHP